MNEIDEQVLFDPELYNWVMDHPVTPPSAVSDGDVAAIEGDVEPWTFLSSTIYGEETFAYRVMIKKCSFAAGSSWELVVDDSRSGDFILRQDGVAAAVRPGQDVTLLARPQYGQGQDRASIPQNVRRLLIARGHNPSEWNPNSPKRTRVRWHEMSIHPQAKVFVYGLVTRVLDSATPQESCAGPYRSPSETMIEIGPTKDGLLLIADRRGLATFQYEQGRKHRTRER